MPSAPPRICRCGAVIPGGQRCPTCSKTTDRQRGTARQRGYTTAWEKARREYLAAYPLCVMCQAEGRKTPATVVDHKTPHRGDQGLFWDRSNWQGLCDAHHNRDKQRIERRRG